MQVGLFIPCYVDQFYPRVGLATVRILKQHGVSVHFPREQTCCGQPMANTGCTADARPLAERFLEIFRKYDYVVAPSGSCVAMVRNHYDEFLAGRAGFEDLKRKTFELCEFLVDVLKVDRVPGRFPRRVVVHHSCHGLRELRSGRASELVAADYSKTHQLLGALEGIGFVYPERADECCGFGGTFAVSEEAVSCMMGNDRIDEFLRAGAEVVTAGDMSCLMHLAGLIARRGLPLEVMHVAEILAGQPEKGS